MQLFAQCIDLPAVSVLVNQQRLAFPEMRVWIAFAAALNPTGLMMEALDRLG